MFRPSPFKQRGRTSASPLSSPTTTSSPSPLDELYSCINKFSKLQEGIQKSINDDFELKEKKKKKTLKSTQMDTSHDNNYDDGDDYIHAEFITITSHQEEEIIELIRRIAEIVVQAEQRAAADDDDDDTATNNNTAAISSVNSAVFEYFCEANVLGNIVNFVTGLAFTSPSNDDNKDQTGEVVNSNRVTPIKTDDGTLLSDEMKQLNIQNNASDTDLPNAESTFLQKHNDNGKNNRHYYLPTLPIVTQAIQSVSILIQNVARVTSLYFILSNNTVNDLINLPLQHYYEAEYIRYEQQNGHNHSNNNINHNNKNNTEKNYRSSRKQKRRRRPTRKSQSAEMSELTTLFISFLKSLAMRMNPETLQFYLTYPTTTTPSSSSASKNHNNNNDEVDYRTIQFPLYARALEFCSPEEDTFVRVTAMNICLNTLRLATNGEPLRMGESQSIHHDGGEDDNEYKKNNNKDDGNGNDIDDDNNKNERPDKKLSPDGSSLHLNKALPFRERLVIAHYVCQPMHVQSLTSATFTKIGQLCSSLEETIRNLDRIDWILSKSNTSVTQERKQQEDVTEEEDQQQQQQKQEHQQKQEQEEMTKEQKEELQIDRIRFVKQFYDLAADFQDEVYLLEDVLAVGLVPLNEQIIEMIFAGIVYPLVLQPLQIYQSHDDKGNMDSKKTNQVADISLAKAAFFVVGSIYHFINHKAFLYLLLTALLHPLAPVASKSMIQTERPCVVYRFDNGDIQIKTDSLQSKNSLDCYLFGRKNEKIDVNYMNGIQLLNETTYVLSPALAQLFDANTDSQVLRCNPYRRSFLACLSGTDGMIVLQPLAIYAMDAILSTIKPEVLKNIMFGANILPGWNIIEQHNDITGSASSKSKKSNTENNMVEVVASMCRSIISTTLSPVGIWSLKFDLVASHAICCVILVDDRAKSTAQKLIEHQRREIASFMAQMPSRLSKHTAKNTDDKKLESRNSASLDEDLKMDRIFFDSFCHGDKFAVENIVRKQNDDSWKGRALIAVAKDGNMDDFCKLICSDPSVNTGMRNEAASYRYAANSAVAYLQLDAFACFIKQDLDITLLVQQERYLGVSALALSNKCLGEGNKNTDRVLLSPLADSFHSLLFDEDTSGTENIPRSGAVVQLVGKTAFPCVCEVTKESNYLFSDSEVSVIAEGIKWQSLWMVLVGQYMILAEPVKNDSGGHGRVITSYPLCSLSAEKDDSADILQSASPARRLLLTHFSAETKPPALFIIDQIDKNELVNNDEIQIVRSAMDLWFEDSTAAAKALKVLNSKIAKARSKRGRKIREALEHEDRLRFKSLL